MTDSTGPGSGRLTTVPSPSRSSLRCSPGPARAWSRAGCRSARRARPPPRHASSSTSPGSEGGSDVERYADEAAARRAIEKREVYGAFVAAPGRATVLASSAASPAVAQILSASGREAGDGAQGAGGKMTVGDVVPAGHAGAAPPSSILPLVLAGILTDEGASVLVAGRMARRAGLVVAGSVLAGLTATAIVQSWLGVVDGEWVANAAGLSLTVLAISAVVAALHTVLGEAGTALGALTMILVGTRSPRSARRRSSCPGRSAPSASSCRPAPAGTCCPAPHV